MKDNNSDLIQNGLNEQFLSPEIRDDTNPERVQNIPLSDLHPFKNHPFKTLNSGEMYKMAESIELLGTINPVLARPRKDSGYELISGHRRLAACKALGLETIPVIVRNLNDEESVIAMVDANLQREHILPSEKAFAYKMKYDALSHQGTTSRQVGAKLRTSEFMAKDATESARQIQRYIRLTKLIPELLQIVDEGKMGFNPAVEISYLSESEQEQLLDAIEFEDCTPSHAQAIRLKMYSQEDSLDRSIIDEIMSEDKPNQKEQYRFRREDIRKYFPASYTDKQVYDAVFKALELLKRQRERSQDAR